MVAVDAAGRQLECVWTVLVAPLVELGQVNLDLPNGTYTTSGQFQRTAQQATTGRIYKMLGKTADRLRGSGSSAAAKLQKGSDKYTGRPLTLKRNDTKGSISVPRVPLSFAGGNTSDVELVVDVVRNARSNSVTYKVYGQVLEYLF
jgi:hypothetical protein